MVLATKFLETGTPAMADLALGLFAGLLELAIWLVWSVLPAICYLTAFVLVYAVTFGRVALEYPGSLSNIRWTGLNWIKRSPQGRTILSPALGVIIGFTIWAVIASALIIFRSYS
jgi:hypothetical protein